MKKIILLSFIMSIMCVGIVYAKDLNTSNNSQIYYSNSRGLELSQEEYDYLADYLDPYTFDTISQEEYNYFISDIKNNVSTNTTFVKTTYSKNKLGKINEIDHVISEKELICEFNNRNISTLSLDDRTSTVTTAMKKITMSMINVSASVKTVKLTCEWLSIPKVKSFDIIAFRTKKADVIFKNSTGSNCVEGYQYHDGKSLHYRSDSDNIKYKNGDIGISMNIFDNTKKNLVCVFSVPFASAQDPLLVYGTYQHAIKDLTLKESKSYSFHPLGLGDVVYFDSETTKKYDATPGLFVVGSVKDI